MISILKSRFFLGALLLFSFTLTGWYAYKIWQFQTHRSQLSMEEPYFIYLYDGSLYLYDFDSRQDQQLFSGLEITDFALGPNQEVAIVTRHEGLHELYVAQYPFQSETLTLIASDNKRILTNSWSQKGGYLSYQILAGSPFSYNGSDLFIWNGHSSDLIFESLIRLGDFSWGPREQLAFTEFGIEGDFNSESEIFIWDTQQIINLSQDPTNQDQLPKWSSAGEIAFLSTFGKTTNLLIWDGISMKNDLPNKENFESLTSGNVYFFSSLEWTNEDKLTFSGGGPSTFDIYMWDGYLTTTLSQAPQYDVAWQQWRSDGYWVYSTAIFHEPQIYIHDNENKLVTIAVGRGGAWSKNGVLMYCSNPIETYRWDTSIWYFPQLKPIYSKEWALSVWDGWGTHMVVQDLPSGVHASWLNGKSVLCSNR